MWSLYVQILSKVHQKRNFVKLKSVRTLVKLACVADSKSYVVTIYARSCLVCWSLTSLCHSNGHIETMPAREINPFTALIRIRSQFLRTQWWTSNHQRVDMTTPQTAQPSGLACQFMWKIYHPVQRSWGQLKDHIHVYDFLYMCFMSNMVITWTIQNWFDL